MPSNVLLFAAVALSGCAPGVGACDEDAALELVYDQSGVPAFAGQALIIESCGNGGFCHTSEVDEPGLRFGAPAGLSFDLRIASTTPNVERIEAERLLDDQLRVLHMRGAVWEQISSGRMPPGGDVGDRYRERVATRYERVAADGTLSPLPGLDTPEGREIVRNWLSCRTPVVERTVQRVDRELNVTGYTAPLCERTCVDLTWPAIYAGIIGPSCALGGCHVDTDDVADPAAQLDLGGGPDVAFAALSGVSPAGLQCRSGSDPGAGDPLVVPGDAMASLLFLKVSASTSDDVCGARMPIGGNALPEQRLCAIQAWIDCGACTEADGGSCAACLDGRRADCNVRSTGECIDTVACSNRLP